MENEFKADPAKYKRLSKPYKSTEEAEANSRAFLAEVATLREKYHIPEALLQFILYIEKDDEVFAMRGGAGWGDQTKQAELAKRMFDQEFQSLCYMVQTLSMHMPKLRVNLITDPKGDETHDPPETQQGIE